MKHVKHICITLAILMGVAVLPGCGSKAERASKDYIKNMEKIADAVEDVDDEKSAKKAAKTIAGVAEDMEKLIEKYEDIPDEEMEAAMKEFSEEVDELGSRIQKAMMKLMSEDPKLLQIINEEVADMPQFKN